jgi:hypothetical protein
MSPRWIIQSRADLRTYVQNATGAAAWDAVEELVTAIDAAPDNPGFGNPDWTEWLAAHVPALFERVVAEAERRVAAAADAELDGA